jgi:hypothetical protein
MLASAIATVDYRGAPQLERRAGNAFMGDSKTSLVNTRIAQVDAPESALRLYRRLVDVPYSLGLVFPVRNDFAGFDEVIDWRFRRLICGVEIHATGHEWRSENGAPNLVKDGKTYGNLFYNYEGGSR